MLRLLHIPLLMLPLLLSGCGGAYFVGVVSNPGNPVHVSGTISGVQVGFYDDRHGTVVTFTAVGFVNAGALTTINFCGDQQNLFPMDQFAHADFNTGIYCSTLIAVTIQS